MEIWSDSTHIYGLLVKPSERSDPAGHPRTRSPSDKRPALVSHASRVSWLLQQSGRLQVATRRHQWDNQVRIRSVSSSLVEQGGSFRDQNLPDLRV